MDKKYAYCTVITNDNYTPCILLNKKIMEQLQCEYPFIVLVTDNVSQKTITTLKENHIIVKNTQFFQLTHKNTMKRFQNTIMIYSPLMLTEYSKIIFFEADILLLENCDVLFNYETSDTKPFYFYDDFICDIFNIKYFHFPVTEFYICTPSIFHYNVIFYEMLPYCTLDHEIASIFYYHCLHSEVRKKYIHFAGRKKPWYNINLYNFYKNITDSNLIKNLIQTHSIYDFVKIFTKY